MAEKSKFKKEEKYSKKRKFDKKANEDTASNSKRALKQARQAHRPHSETVVAAKELWNKLRLKTNTPEQIATMMKEMMDLLTGKFSQVALQHDASRVVQAAIQHGNKNQRKIIIKEICEGERFIELAKSQYAHFVVLKMIKHSVKDDESIRLIVKVRCQRNCRVFISICCTKQNFSNNIFMRHIFTDSKRTHHKTCSARSWSSSCRTSLCYIPR
jgi:pumilio family protein 6